MEYKSLKFLFVGLYLTVLFTFLSFTASASNGRLSAAAVKRFHIKDILADTNTSPLVKKLYLTDHWKYSASDTLLNIVDSLGKIDNYHQGFYIMIIAKSYEQADGYYSEGLGSAGKSYIEQDLPRFLSYFIGKGKLPEYYLRNWAKIVTLELRIGAEDNPRILTEISSLYNEKCKLCNVEQKRYCKDLKGYSKQRPHIISSKFPIFHQ